MGLNVKNQYLGNKEARQAMKYLVDYEGLQKTMFNGTGVSTRPSCRTVSSAPTTRRRSTRHREGQGAAGQGRLPNGFDVTMDVTNRCETRELSASMQNTMAKAGVNLIIKTADNKTTLTKYRASEHDIYLGQWGSDYRIRTRMPMAI